MDCMTPALYCLSRICKHAGDKSGVIILLVTLVSVQCSENLYASSKNQEILSSSLRSLTVAQQQSNELRILQDRVMVLEEQQGFFFDDMAQQVILGGYGALEFSTFSSSRTTFEGKFEVLISGQIHDRIRFYSEIDLGVPKEEASAEQAYVDFLITKWVNLRGGVLLVPFGKVNLDHFDPRRDLTDRPLVARQIVPTTWSDLGVSLFGLVPVTPYLTGTYEVALVNGLTNTFGPSDAGFRNARSSLAKDNNGDKAVVGRVTLKLADQYEIGISGYDGSSSPTNGSTIYGYGADGEFKPRGIPIVEDFELKGEFAHFSIEGTTLPSRLYGYYAQINYHFWLPALDHTFLGHLFDSPTFTAIVRYGHATIKTTAGTGTLNEDRWTFGLNYRPLEDYVIKTEYQINHGKIERKGADGFLASIAWLF